MHFALICIDRPGSAEIRKENRDAHLAHLGGVGDAVQMAGPFMDDDGGMCGSLIVVEMADRAEVEAWAAEDPYARAGLFERVEIRPWKKVIG